MADLVYHYAQAGSKRDFAERYFAYLSEIMARLDAAVIERIIDELLEARERGSVIYFIGNGGSAATASHFANDLAFGVRAPGFAPFKVISLVDNVAAITALANDDGYANVFVRQLEGLLQEGDVVVGLSVSGNSANVVEAMRFANERGAITISCTGFDGGALAQSTDINLHVPSTRGEYGPVEDIFAILDHLIYSYLRIMQRGSL